MEECDKIPQNTLIYLLENSSKDFNSNFRTRNTIGRSLYGNCYIGSYEDKDFFIELSFGVIFFIPIIPLSYHLTFSEKNENKENIILEIFNSQKKILGILKRQHLKSCGINVNKIILYSYINGIIKGGLKILIFGIALKIASILFFIVQSFF